MTIITVPPTTAEDLFPKTTDDLITDFCYTKKSFKEAEDNKDELFKGLALVENVLIGRGIVTGRINCGI